MSDSRLYFYKNNMTNISELPNYLLFNAIKKLHVKQKSGNLCLKSFFSMFALIKKLPNEVT